MMVRQRPLKTRNQWDQAKSISKIVQSSYISTWKGDNVVYDIQCYLQKGGYYRHVLWDNINNNNNNNNNNNDVRFL